MSNPSINAESLLSAQWYTEQLTQLSPLSARLPGLCQSLQPFSFPAVASPFASLQTLPKYQVATRRLSALIHLARLHCRGTGSPTHRELNTWLAQITEDTIVHLEDPIEDVHVSNVATSRGNRLLLQGDMVTADQYIQDVLLLLSRLNSPWAASSLRHVHAILRISDVLCHRAGLNRNISEDSPPRVRVQPSRKVLRESSEWVKFSKDELHAVGLSLEDLEPYFLESEDVPAREQSSEALGHSHLERQPLYRLNSELRVLLPTELWSAALRSVLERACSENDLARTTRILTELQVQQVVSLVGHNWGIDINSPIGGDSQSGIVHCVGTFDVGAYVHVIYVPDDLGDAARSGLQKTHLLDAATADCSAKIAASLSENVDYRRGLTLLVHGGFGRPFLAGFDGSIPNWRHLCLPVGDFCLLSWDTGVSALRMWKILEQEHLLAQRGTEIWNPGGIVNLYAFLKHQGFEFMPRAVSQDAPQSVAIGSEFAGSLRQEIRNALDRHSIQGPAASAWTEVQRKNLDPYSSGEHHPKVYASLQHAKDRRLLGCIETRGRPWWVYAEGTGTKKRDSQLVFGVWETALNLLARFAPMLGDELRLPEEAAVVYRLQFPDVTDFPETLDVEVPNTESPHLAVNGTHAKIVCPIGYLCSFARPENSADRQLAMALVKCAYAMVDHGAPTEEELDRWINRGISSIETRSFHMHPVWTAADTIRERVGLPEPRLEQSEDSAWSRLGIAQEAGFTSPPGVVPEERVNALLNNAVEAIWKRIKEQLESIERRSVIERALLNWEAIQKDRAEWNLAAAALLAGSSKPSDMVEAARRRENDRAVAGLSCRVIAEMAVCTAPVDGGRSCALADLDSLIAQVSRLLECAAQSDAHHYGLSRVPPTVHANGVLECPVLQGAGVATYWQVVGARDFRVAAAEYGVRFVRDKEPVALEADFAAAFRDEFGLRIEDSMDILEWLKEEALGRKAAQIWIGREELLTTFQRAGVVQPERAYEKLTLFPRSKWDEENPEGARMRDWYPWRYNRRLSILRRPFIQLLGSLESPVLVSPTRFEQTLVYLSQARTGDLPESMFEGDAMRQHIGRMAHKYGHRFAEEVATKCGALGWHVRTEVPMTGVGGTAELGDIDVLAWNTGTGVVMAIECKRLLMDKTVGEVGERLREFSVGGNGEKISALGRHLRRISYLQGEGRERVAEVTDIRRTRLRIQGGLVTDAPTPMEFDDACRKTLALVADVAVLERKLKKANAMRRERRVRSE